MSDQPLMAHPSAVRPQCDRMYLPAPVVPATVPNLLGLYGSSQRATGLTVERFPFEGKSSSASTDLRLLQDGRLVTALPMFLLHDYAVLAPGWALLHRLNVLLTGERVGLYEIVDLEPELPVARLVNGKDYWNDRPGETHRRLSGVSRNLHVLVWNPIVADYEPASVRERLHPSWEAGQGGFGAILEHPAGLERYMADAVAAALSKVKAAVRGMLAD